MTSPAELQAQADALAWYHTIDLGHGVITKGIGLCRPAGARTSPSSGGAACSTSAPGTGSSPSWPSGPGPAGWLRSTTTRGASTSRHGGPLGRVHRESGYSPDRFARRPTSGNPTSLGGGASSSPSPRSAPRWSRSWPTSRPSTSPGSGQFDVVLYLGVLYHMKEPLTCLERLRAVTKEVAVIETEAVHIEGLDPRPWSSSTPAARCTSTSGTGTCPRSRRCATCAGGRLLRGRARSSAAASSSAAPPAGGSTWHAADRAAPTTASALGAERELRAMRPRHVSGTPHCAEEGAPRERTAGTRRAGCTARRTPRGPPPAAGPLRQRREGGAGRRRHT